MNKEVFNQTELQATENDAVLEISDLGSISGDTQKYFKGFEQTEPYLYWT